MTRIKQSISWWCFVPQHMTPEALVRTAAEIGYAAIELVEPEDYQLIKDHGLANRFDSRSRVDCRWVEPPRKWQAHRS